MKEILLLAFTFFMVNHTEAQIWNYPPQAVSNWQENESIPKDSLKLLKVWNHEVIDGKETGNKELKLTQEFDTSGNTISLIYGDGTAEPVLFDHYVNGFWQLKIVDGKSIHQTVKFDASGNLVRQSINDLVITYEYDSINRPVRKDLDNEFYLW